MKSLEHTRFIGALVVAVILLGIVGVGFVEHGGMCPFAMLMDGSCVDTESALTIAVHHIAGVQHLLEYYISNTLLSHVLALLIIFVSVTTCSRRSLSIEYISQRLFVLPNKNQYPNHTILRYLSRLNKYHTHPAVS
jgi:hypothetical protein